MKYKDATHNVKWQFLRQTFMTLQSAVHDALELSSVGWGERGTGGRRRVVLILLHSSNLIIRHQDVTVRTLTGVATSSDDVLDRRVTEVNQGAFNVVLANVGDVEETAQEQDTYRRRCPKRPSTLR